MKSRLSKDNTKQSLDYFTNNTKKRSEFSIFVFMNDLLESIIYISSKI
jgi:hypothetical protein